VPFQFVSAGTSNDGSTISITLNKEISDLTSVPGDFQLTAAGVALNVTAVTSDPANSRRLILTVEPSVRFQQVVKISYSGSSVQTGNDLLTAFTNRDVKNNLKPRYTIPTLIQAEAFNFNNGFQLEDCTDTGGGKNTGFANPGDYLDYLIYVPNAGEYTLNIRYATQSTTGRINVLTGSDGSYTNLGTVSFASTGGWQTWRNVQIKIILPQGDQTLRFFAVAGEFNINWFELALPNAIEDQKLNKSLKVYPNPGNGSFRVNASLDKKSPLTISISNIKGKTVFSKDFAETISIDEMFDIPGLTPGTYVLNVRSNRGNASAKIFIN
jgi:hypothetical protein